MKSFFLISLIAFATSSSQAQQEATPEQIKKVMSCHQVLQGVDPLHQIFDFDGWSIARSFKNGPKGELRLTLSDGKNLYTVVDALPKGRRFSYHQFRLVIPGEGKNKVYCVKMTADEVLRDQVTKMDASPPANCEKDRVREASLAKDHAATEALQDMQIHLAESIHAVSHIVARFADRPGTSSNNTQEYMDKLTPDRLKKCEGLKGLDLHNSTLNAFLRLKEGVDRSNSKTTPTTPVQSSPGQD